MAAVLFDPLVLKNRIIPNRFLAQAMEGNDGDRGAPSERTIGRYTELARGGWGVTVVEAVSVWETSLARINGMILNRKNLDPFKRLIGEFKKYNNEGLVFVQLTHSGERSGKFSEIVGVTPGAAGPRYLASDEIERIKDAFVEAALLVRESGADGIDFKMCHGYFCGEMLRPANTRDDKWGGSLENRTRFFRESAAEIKSRMADQAGFIMGSRISLYEGIRGGCGTTGRNEIIEDLSEMLDVIRYMDDLGMDFVNVSAGIPALTGAITRPAESSKYLVLHQLRYAKTVKEMIQKEKRSLKVIGSAYSTFKEEAPLIMEEMLGKSYVDLCGFGRQIFADPLTPVKLKRGEKINWCVLCSGCSKLMAAQMNDGCIIYNPYYREVNRNCKA
jgi:2,4-dienoyl-CoA reductase-like NADH-dependent reductase (Old Yellow Enzyme family)